MATAPQIAKQSGLELDIDGNDIIPADHKLPGWTVNALLDQGKVEEARAEFERLIQEGIDSGPGIEGTPQFYEDVLTEVDRRAEARR